MFMYCLSIHPFVLLAWKLLESFSPSCPFPSPLYFYLMQLNIFHYNWNRNSCSKDCSLFVFVSLFFFFFFAFFLFNHKQQNQTKGNKRKITINILSKYSRVISVMRRLENLGNDESCWEREREMINKITLDKIILYLVSYSCSDLNRNLLPALWSFQIYWKCSSSFIDEIKMRFFNLLELKVYLPTLLDAACDTRSFLSRLWLVWI